MSFLRSGAFSPTPAVNVIASVAPCDRCLEDVEVKVTLDFKHKIDTESDAYDQSEDLDENNYIDGYSLDVERRIGLIS